MVTVGSHRDLDATRAALREIAAVEVEDGLHVDPGALRAHAIWGDTDWPGVRAQLAVPVAGISAPITVDVGFGDRSFDLW